MTTGSAVLGAELEELLRHRRRFLDTRAETGGDSGTGGDDPGNGDSGDSDSGGSDGESSGGSW